MEFLGTSARDCKNKNSAAPVSEGGAKGQLGGKSALVCYRCQKRGHIARECLASAPVPAGNEGGEVPSALGASCQ